MKKAALNISLMEIIGLIIGSIVILTLIFFIVGISDLFKSNPEQAMYDNYDVLIISVQDLVKGKEGDSLSKLPGRRIEIVPSKNNAVQASIPLYIQNGYAIVGFDREQIGEFCGGFYPSTLAPVKKPDSCSRLPCICLAKSSEEYSLEAGKASYLNCVTINNVKSISASSGSKNNYGALSSGEYKLLARGKCKSDADFGVKNVNIIRMPSDEQGKFNIFFDIQ